MYDQLLIVLSYLIVTLPMLFRYSVNLLTACPDPPNDINRVLLIFIVAFKCEILDQDPLLGPREREREKEKYLDRGRKGKGQILGSLALVVPELLDEETL